MPADADYDEDLDVALAAGYVFKTTANGWVLFCEELSVPAWALWETNPGYERLQQALRLAQKAAFAPEGFQKWVDRTRKPRETHLPARQPGAADIAEELRRALGRRAGWWRAERTAS